MPASAPPRTLSFEGVLFWPISAGICLTGTTSAVFSLLAVKLLGMPPIDNRWVTPVVVLLYLAALLTSVMGMLAQLVLGNPSTGKLSLRGREIPEWKLAAVIWLCYLAPWIALVTAAFFRHALIR